MSTNCRTQIRSETADSCRPDPIAGLTAAQRSIDLALRRRSLILQAQGLLAEITGCTLGRADAAITRAAQALHLDAVEVAGCLIDSVDGGLNDGSEKLLIRLIQAAGLLRTETAIGPSADLAEICYLGEIPGVRMRGELDLATVDQFLNVATKVTAMRDRATIFYLDLEYMSFIDATGLYVLSASCDQAAKRGDDVLVATPTAATSRRVLKIAVDRGWLPTAFSPATKITERRAPSALDRWPDPVGQLAEIEARNVMTTDIDRAPASKAALRIHIARTRIGIGYFFTLEEIAALEDDAQLLDERRRAIDKLYPTAAKPAC